MTQDERKTTLLKITFSPEDIAEWRRKGGIPEGEKCSILLHVLGALDWMDARFLLDSAKINEARN